MIPVLYAMAAITWICAIWTWVLIIRECLT